MCLLDALYETQSAPFVNLSGIELSHFIHKNKLHKDSTVFLYTQPPVHQSIQFLQAPDTSCLKQWLTGRCHIAGTQIRLTSEATGNVSVLISGLKKGALEASVPLRNCATIHAVIVVGVDNRFEIVPHSQIDLAKFERLARLKLNEYELKIWAELEPV